MATTAVKTFLPLAMLLLSISAAIAADGQNVPSPEAATFASTTAPATQSAADGLSFGGLGEQIDDWHGYRRHKFSIGGRRAWVVEPHTPASGNPWVWCVMFPDVYLDRTGALKMLDKGFFYVTSGSGNTFGSPDALDQCDAFYNAITDVGLAKRGTLEGVSRGGLFVYNWAARHPERVICIYGDAPVCDFKSWPGGKGSSKGSASDWLTLMQCYHFKDEAEALAWKHNPIDELAPLAKAGIPLLHVVGDADTTVPPAENTAILKARYEALGGHITVLHKPGVGHHPHGLDNPQPIVDFITAAQEQADKAK